MMSGGDKRKVRDVLNAADRDIFLVCNLRNRRAAQDQRQPTLPFDDVLDQGLVSLIGWLTKMQLQLNTPPTHLERCFFNQSRLVEMLGWAVEQLGVRLRFPLNTQQTRSKINTADRLQAINVL